MIIKINYTNNQPVIKVNYIEQPIYIKTVVDATYIKVDYGVGGGGAAVWGGITGTLSDQTDLQSALDLKVPTSRTLTINGTLYDLSANRSWTTPSGTVTSVDMSVPTGLTILGNPITTSGTLALGLASGYSIPTTASQTNWNTAYNDSIISASVTGTTTKTLTLTQQDTGTITTTWTDTSSGLSSVGLSMPTAFNVTNSPLTSNGTIAVTANGNTTQFIDGTGALQTFPTLLESDSLIANVRNQSGATMIKGTIVYISGATGNKALISKALATGDATSAQTFGMLQNDIANNADGHVVIIGDVTDINTVGYPEGTQLYLSGTTAGTWTSTKPYAPTHLVYVGIVIREHINFGVISIKIQNGYEMDELHNVSAQSPTNNDGLFWNSSTNLWSKNTIAGVLGYTPANGNIYTADGTLTAARTLTHGGFNLSFVGSTFTNRFTSTGRLLLGTTTENTSALLNITSTTQGFLPPRMTLAQKTAIATPAEGLMVYQTDGVKGWWGYDGSAWRALAMI